MNPAGESPTARQLLALFLVSAVLLAQQVWLTRMIAIQHWHHLAPLVIAIALLGFGSAGVLVSLRARRICQLPMRWLWLPTLLLGPALMAGVILGGYLPLNMLALPWQPEQMGWLGFYALCFFPGFFLGALFVAVCFVCWPAQAGRVYAFDLAGGAFGALGILPLIRMLGLEAALLLLSLIPPIAALLIAPPRSREWLSSGLVALVLVPGFLAVQVAPAEYKAQSQRQLERGSHLLLQSDGLSHRHTVLDSPGMHGAPGLSLSSEARAPKQWQWFADGDSPVSLLLPPLPAADFYRDLLGFAPYALQPAVNSALVLGASNLWQTWLATAAGAVRLDLAIADREIIAFLEQLRQRQPAGIYPGDLALLSASPRRYLAFTNQYYDIVALEVASPEAGLAAIQENYLLTLEGLGAAYARLESGGILAIKVQLHSSPREVLKLVRMLSVLLRQEGRVPDAHIAVVRDWRTAFVMVASNPYSNAAIGHLRTWAGQRQFDLVAVPGLQAGESNRFHRLDQDYYHPVAAILAGAEDNEQYLFDLSPPTDDRPFFFRFFRWQSLPQLLASTGSLWRQHLDWGYLLGLGTLLTGLLLSVSLLLLPARLSGPEGGQARPALLYFVAIGLGYMLVEMGLLQKLTLLLDASAISMSAVLAAMLAGSGLGSLWQLRWKPSYRAMTGIFALVAFCAATAPFVLEILFTVAAGWPLVLRLAVAVLLIGLISLPMGMPLPFAIQQWQEAPPATIARAWAVNGFASVLAALAGALIAVHLGLTVLMLIAAACYLVAGLSIRTSDWRTLVPRPSVSGIKSD